MSSLESKVPPPAVVLLMGMFMWQISGAAQRSAFHMPWHNLLAVVFIAVGFATGTSGMLTFLRAKTTTNPIRPHASSLVTWGVYAISRNPMYLGGLIMLFGWGLFLSNVLAFLLLPLYVLYINRFQIAPEERVLFSLFGPAFVAYRGRVRRWL